MNGHLQSYDLTDSKRAVMPKIRGPPRDSRKRGGIKMEEKL
jgi:hypothetical protein